MEKDLGSIKFKDFDYGEEIPEHLSFLGEEKPSWLKVFESIIPPSPSKRRRINKRGIVIKKRGIDLNKLKRIKKSPDEKRIIYQNRQIRESSDCSNISMNNKREESSPLPGQGSMNSPSKLNSSFLGSLLNVKLAYFFPYF